jgi:YidC/Oxa1 family membrane protein insertase
VLNFIYYPVSGILWVWHKVFSVILPDGEITGGINWALSVVFLVFSLRLILFKPFVHQVKSMRKMAEFQPEIKKLQKKYANDKQKLAAEMQKLQSEHGVNPLGGCLPMLVQVPVFIGLNHVLRSFMRPGLTSDQNAAIANYWIPPDDVHSFLEARLFGAPLSSYITLAQSDMDQFVPHVDRITVILVSIPLMIVASIATHLTAKHNVARQTAAVAANPQTGMMNKLTLYLFPLGVLVFGAFLQLGLLLYWLSNNGWTLFQQYVVYRKIDREEAEAKAKAVETRNNLAPKPGQKPMQQVKKVTQQPKAPDSPSATAADKTTTGATNGAAAGGNGDVAPGEIPGLIEDRSRSKKQSRKRR